MMSILIHATWPNHTYRNDAWIMRQATEAQRAKMPARLGPWKTVSVGPSKYPEQWGNVAKTLGIYGNIMEYSYGLGLLAIFMATWSIYVENKWCQTRILLQ